MKFTAVLATALATIGSVSAAACTSAQTQAAVVSLASLATGSELSACGTESGYSLLFATSLPTDEQYVKMCASNACHGLLSQVLSKNPPDCDLTIPTSGLVVNVLQLAKGFDGKCSSLTPTTAPTSGPTTAPTSGPTTAPTSGPTTAPTTTPTKAPAC